MQLQFVFLMGNLKLPVYAPTDSLKEKLLLQASFITNCRMSSRTCVVKVILNKDMLTVFISCVWEIKF